jgi:hypothetical protein
MSALVMAPPSSVGPDPFDGDGPIYRRLCLTDHIEETYELRGVRVTGRLETSALGPMPNLFASVELQDAAGVWGHHALVHLDLSAWKSPAVRAAGLAGVAAVYLHQAGVPR